MKMNREEPKKWHFNPAVRRPYDAPSTWFEAVYTEAENDMNMVPWAGQTTQSLLLPWLERQQDLAAGNWRTLVVGCGLGDDAETLAQRHLHVRAFDISPRAIAWCRQRFPTSRVAYQVADLFDLPKDFRQAFTLVYEALTIQSLPPGLHAGAIAAIADCVAPGGILLLMCCGRDWEEPTDGPPWPLARSELACFLQHGLQEVCFQEHMLAGVRRFLVEYRKA
jgi:SAM-dependent methyltransferase